MSLKSYQRISPFLFPSQLCSPPFSARNASYSSLVPNPGKFGGQRLPYFVLSRLTFAMLAALTSTYTFRHKSFLRRCWSFDSYNLPYSYSPEPRRHSPRVSVARRSRHRTPGRSVRALRPFTQDRRSLLRCKLGLRTLCDVHFMNQTSCYAASFL